MINFFLLFSRQGKTRLAKWFSDTSHKDQKTQCKEITDMVLSRNHKLCNIIEWQGKRIVYKRYASLYFAVCIDPGDNELLALEIIHIYVEVLDRYFGNVCELDLIFNFHKAYYILDELLINGVLQETSKKDVLRFISQQDELLAEKDDKK